MEILHNGKALLNPWILPVGSTITDLSYRILDEGGEVINLSDLGCQNSKYSGLTISWATTNAKSKIRKAVTPELPNIIIPSTYSSEPMEYSVDLRLDDDNLSFQFEIKMTPGKAVAWKIMNAKDSTAGIISNCSLDLSSKIQGVCLIDSFGNMVDIDEEGSVNFQIPVITASFHKPRSQDSIAIALNSEIDDDNYHDDVGGSRRSERNDKRKRGKEMVCRSISVRNNYLLSDLFGHRLRQYAIIFLCLQFIF